MKPQNDGLFLSHATTGYVILFPQKVQFYFLKGQCVDSSSVLNEEFYNSFLWDLLFFFSSFLRSSKGLKNVHNCLSVLVSFEMVSFMFKVFKSFVALSPGEYCLVKCLQRQDNPNLLASCSWYSCEGKKQFFIPCNICH